MFKKELMEKLARESNEKVGFNGAWLYAENGVVLSKGAVGFCDPEDSLPLAENTVFQLASVSKQFTAAAVMLMIREGLLSLEDELTRFFPELTAYKGVTIRHLLTHTGGVPDYFDDEDWFIKIWKEEKRVPGNDEIPRFLLETKAKAYFAPGEGFKYSNTGFNLLALIVERVSGIPYERFLQKNIFEPAGMSNTRCCHIRRDGVPFDNYAQAMVFEKGRYIADVDSEEVGCVTAFDGLNGDDYVYTDIFDMFAWDRALREGKVLTSEEQKLMYTPAKLNNGEEAVYDGEEGLGYGFGWAVGRDKDLGLVVSHSGGMPGVAAWFERFIDADRVLVFLLNRDPEDYRAADGFWNGMRKIARDKEPEPIRSIEDIAVKNTDKTGWKAFCGKYEHPEKAEFIVDEIFMKDGELYATAVNDDGCNMEFRLYPIGENKFARKGGMIEITFGDGCMMFDDLTFRKQNLYDNEVFFEDFLAKRAQEINFNDCIETPILLSMLPDLRGKEILDVGCGMGQHARQYADMGASSVLGVDISEKMLGFAREHNSADNITYRLMAMENIDALEQRFDVITSSLAFDYVEDFERMMKLLNSLLRQDGRLIFSMSHPMATAWDGTYDRYTRTEDGERLYANISNYNIEGLRKVKWVVEGYEFYHRTVSSLINSIVKAGFIIEECRESDISDEMRKKYPDMFGGVIHRPDFIFFRCRKDKA